jgi:hypothetical protein
MNATQTTLIEGPRACTECRGKGETVLRGCEHQGNCPCGEDRAFPCPRCEGSKVEPCDSCGEPSVDRYQGEDLCAGCLPSEEQRFDACSICAGPIDVRESRLPLCPYCRSVAQAHGELLAEARRYEREQAAR